MKAISTLLDDHYSPVKLLAVYSSNNANLGYYVESYDLDDNGLPINAHPLSRRESMGLAEALQSARPEQDEYLQSRGIIPTNVLHIRRSGHGGHAIWTSPAGERTMHFTKYLDIPDGPAHVPSMLWKAGEKKLQVWALADGKRPTENTPLFQAPFFNVYSHAGVCMGTASIDINAASLEDFMKAWEDAFWNSAFSHLNGSGSPVVGNIVSLWKSLIGTGKRFPARKLKRFGNKTLKDIIHEN